MGLVHYTHQDAYTNAYLKMKEKEKLVQENYGAKIITVDNFVSFNLNENAKNIVIREGTYTKEHLESIIKLFEAKTAELNSCANCKKQKCDSCKGKTCECKDKCDCESKKMQEEIAIQKTTEQAKKMLEISEKIVNILKQKQVAATAKDAVKVAKLQEEQDKLELERAELNSKK